MADAFDPYFLSQRTLTDSGAVDSVTVVSAEPLLLIAAGASEAAPDGYRVQEVATSGDVFVYGDVVRIRGALKQPGRAVKINARVLELEADANKMGPRVDVGGLPGSAPSPALVKKPQNFTPTNAQYTYKFFGQDPYTAPSTGPAGDPGTAGEVGATGGPSGWVDIRCGEVNSIDGVPLAISAVGGTGGDGQDGQPGQDGGDGGNGADAWHGGFNDTQAATNGGDAGAGGAGGPGGPGGAGGAGGTVSVLSKVDLPPKTVTATVDCGKPGRPGNVQADGSAGNAADGRDGKPGAGGASFSYDAGIGELPDTVKLPAGSAGAVGSAKARNAAQPAPTTQVSSGTSTIAGNQAATDIALTISFDQLGMLGNRCRTDLLGLDRSSQAAVESLAKRLKWLGSMSAVNPNKEVALTAINAAATAQLAHLGNPYLDAFGQSMSWAPLASLSDYDALLGTEISGSQSVFRAAETAWSQYQSARVASEELTSQRDSLLKSATQQLRDLQKAKDGQWKAAKQLVADISDLAAIVEDAKRAVLSHLQQFVKNIKDKVTLDPMKYLDVIEQTAYAMSDPKSAAIVFGAEEIKFWKGAFADVQSDTGEQVSKSLLLGRIDVLGQDVKDLDEAYTVVDGFIQQNDPDGYKLLCTQQKLDDLLDNYSFQEGAKDAEKAMDDFVSAVQRRNGKILDYNAAVAAYVQLGAQVDQLQQKKDGVEADATAAALPIMDRFAQALYEQAKAACIYDLYAASRALRFWTFAEYDVFKDVLQCAGPSDVNYEAIASGHERILTKQVDAVNELVTDLAPRSDPVVLVFDTKSHPDIIRSFKKARGVDDAFNDRPRHWQFVLDPATADSTISDNPFAGMANVRLTEVRCWLIGLESAADATGHIKVHLTQMGDETIVTPTGESVTITHDRVEKAFEYSIKQDVPQPSAVVTPAKYWGVTADGKLPEVTPIGPFATWRVALRIQELSPHVKWDALKAVRLEFFVMWHPF